jgi:hypothetical protein
MAVMQAAASWSKVIASWILKESLKEREDKNKNEGPFTKIAH